MWLALKPSLAVLNTTPDRGSNSSHSTYDTRFRCEGHPSCCGWTDMRVWYARFALSTLLRQSTYFIVQLLDVGVLREAYHAEG